MSSKKVKEKKNQWNQKIWRKSGKIRKKSDNRIKIRKKISSYLISDLLSIISRNIVQIIEIRRFWEEWSKKKKRDFQTSELRSRSKNAFLIVTVLTIFLFQVKINGSNNEMLRNAAENFGNKSDEVISEGKIWLFFAKKTRSWIFDIIFAIFASSCESHLRSCSCVVRSFLAC